jgi:hypothetical protein
MAQHARLLAESRIDPELAARRGYRSVDTKARLEKLNMARAGRRVPGLLIPLRDKRGAVIGCQYRPDSPRQRNGKRVKYETPAAQPNRLDVPPGVGPQLDDPSTPLWITEGTRKADAAASVGLCCVALTGVWNWRGRNATGGKTAIPDWHDVALNGRNVVLAFDSDATRNPNVRKALTELAGYLGSKGGNVSYLHLPDDGDKCGLDDFLAAHEVDDLWPLVHPNLPEMIDPPKTPATEGLYTPRAEGATPQRAPELAFDQDILGRFIVDLHRCGVVGEDRAAKLVYLGITSRVLDEPVSEAVKGVSSSGKSFVIDRALRFFPKSAYIEMTGMSERALIYNREDYRHRTLVVFEAVALREQREKAEGNLTAYFIRSLLSEGRIRYPVTVRDKDGGFTTETIIKEGPTNLILSTTSTSLHPENETRIISLPTNDTNDQTRAVLVETARRRSPSGRTSAPDLSEWNELQEWLAGADHRIFIPYAEYLAENIPPVAVRLRRDFSAVLGLIGAHAVLHQLTREKTKEGWIVATEGDYLAIRELVADLLADGVGATVSPTIRETVEAVARIGGDEGVALGPVAQALGLDKSAVSRRLGTARERGYVSNLEDRRGQPARYVIGDPLPEEVELLPQDLNGWDRERAGQEGCCNVARPAEGAVEATSEIHVIQTLNAEVVEDGEERSFVCRWNGLQGTRS